jgi:CheY-like chemotaxis protein
MSEKKICVVDDEEDILSYLQTALEDNGYLPLLAGNAADALQLIKKEKPDLICLDVLMPKESGISLFQKIKSDPDLRDIPVIISSGLSFSRELKNIKYLELEDGTVISEPDGIVEKPINIDEFITTVAELTNK